MKLEFSGQVVSGLVNDVEKLTSVRQEHVSKGFKQSCHLIRAPF